MFPAGRQHQERATRQLRSSFDPSGERKPVHLRHHGIDEGHAKRLAAVHGPAQRRQGLFPSWGARGLHAPVGQHFLVDAPIGFVVVHHQNGQVAQVNGTQGRASSFQRQAEAGGEVKRAPLAHLALDPAAPAHEARELGGDGQPQAGTPVLARRRTVHLTEAGEDVPEFGGGNADARVPHEEMQNAKVRWQTVGFFYFFHSDF